MKLRKTLNTLLVLGFLLAALGIAHLIVERADQGVMQQAAVNTRLAGTETITTYTFETGELTGRVSALGIGAGTEKRDSLQAGFKAVLNNGLKRPLKLRAVHAVTRAGQRLRQFDYTFEKAELMPGQAYAFSGTAPADAELFNGIVRKFDLALRVQTDIGEIELPSIAYTLEVEAALAAGLLKTNRVSLGETEGVIHFLNCEQASTGKVCDPLLEQMGAP